MLLFLFASQGMLNDDKYGNRPLVYQEVIDYHTEPITMDEYFGSGKVTEFNYGATLKSCIENSRDYECLRGFGEVCFRQGNITFLKTFFFIFFLLFA